MRVHGHHTTVTTMVWNTSVNPSAILRFGEQRTPRPTEVQLRVQRRPSSSTHLPRFFYGTVSHPFCLWQPKMLPSDTNSATRLLHGCFVLHHNYHVRQVRRSLPATQRSALCPMAVAHRTTAGAPVEQGCTCSGICMSIGACRGYQQG